MTKSAMARKTLKSFVLGLFFVLAAGPVQGEGETGTRATFKRDIVRGFKNILTSPVEIPVAVQETHERKGPPFLRQFFGVFEGVFRTVHRANSGVWDVIAAFLPGHQEGIPTEPDTFF